MIAIMSLYYFFYFISDVGIKLTEKALKKRICREMGGKTKRECINKSA